MTKKLMKKAEYKIECDFCGNEVSETWSPQEVAMGNVQTQGDVWGKSILISVAASIPYYEVEDICLVCIEKAFHKALAKARGES